ncbi:MAG: DUF3885 domain-containing protein [Marmoricola sp.]
MPLTPAELTDLWQRRWPGLRPIGHEFKWCEVDRWVRFHSLSDSKRYADTPDESAEILRRHLTVLRELAGLEDAELTVALTNWSDDANERPGPPYVGLVSEYWTSVAVDPEDPESAWAHLYLSSAALPGDGLRRLLLLVADDELGNVMIFDASLDWIYHPYDGGSDVLLQTSTERDRLKAAHRDWLSIDPSGL